MISVAVQRGSYVYAYDDRNKHIFTVKGDLYGFTSTTVSVQDGSYIYVYNERGTRISSHPAR